MLIGSFTNALDSKNRVFVPAAFRSDLGERFILNRGTDPDSLYIYPMKEWEAFEKKLTALPSSKKDYRDILRFYTQDAILCEVDGQGRMLIPQLHQGRIGLTRDVLFIGTIRGVEIWSPERVVSRAPEEIAERIESLDLDF